MQPLSDIETIVFDADDTLWDCQSLYKQAESDYCMLLRHYCSESDVSAALLRTEAAALPLTGYGSKAFILSLIKNAVEISNGRITAGETENILQIGRRLLCAEITPLPGVETTLEALDGHRLALFTKGDNIEQEGKIERSGLAHFFDWIEIVGCKDEKSTLTLCRRMGAVPERTLFVGDSFRSDILPALNIGARVVYVPSSVKWQMEEAEETDNQRLVKLSKISDMLALPGLLCPRRPSGADKRV